MKSNISITFPGQGSQALGMLAALDASFPLVSQTFEEASDALGKDLWRLAQAGPEEALNSTENTQPVMLAAGVAVWRVWVSEGGAEPLFMAGHSLGEYSALVAAGAMEFAAAARIVALRGRLMQEAVPAGQGAMAALLGLDDGAVAEVCRKASVDGDTVEPANFNAPGQVVIAGHRTAVERATALAGDAGAKRAIVLPVSVPSHCRLMQPAAERLAAELAAVELTLPSFTVLHNADVGIAETEDGIRERLVAQLHQPVRWVETVRDMAEQGIENVLELGPGRVLTGLVKRIDRNLRALAVADPAGVEKALEATDA